jgi:hypothetical protein
VVAAACVLPAALVFLITLVAAPVSDAVTFHPDQVGTLLLMAVPQSLWLCIFTLGEERLAGGDSFGR